MTRFLAFGLLFGFVLSRVGATDYNAIAGMFRLNDLHLAGVIGVAIVTAGIMLRLLSKDGALRWGSRIKLQQKKRKVGNVVGGILFGAGWALTGTCPGTGLAQIGEGQLLAIFTVLGLFLGSEIYRRFGCQMERALGRKD